MGSTRLPGKVLQDVAGMTMLQRVVERARRSQHSSSTMVATTTLDRDTAIVSECEALGVAVFRGPEDDVLDRYYRAAKSADADAVVRVTSDCPLLDPEVLDRVVQTYLQDGPDYASNTVERTYPRGLDVEIFSMHSLESAWQEASDPADRVHVTPYFYRNPDRFRNIQVTADRDFSGLRWTVDTTEDLTLVRRVYETLGADRDFSWLEVVDLFKREPSLSAINANIEQKKLEEG